MAKKITSKDRRKIDNLLRSSRDYDDLFFGAQDIKSVNKRISKKKSSFFSARKAEKEGETQFGFLFNWLQGL